MTPPASRQEWSVTSEGWSAENVTHHGNLFLLGNGRMGYRGTLEEFGPEEKVGILLPGLYDRVGDAWREPVNAPNGLYTRVAVNGTWLNPLEAAPVGHRQRLDIRAAVHHRETKFSVEGAEVTIKAERFLSAADVNLMALRYTVSVSGDAEITLESGIDERIWDLNGPHLDNLSVSHQDDAVVLTARTHEKGSEVAVAECCGLTASAPAQSSSVNGALRRWTFRVAGGATFELLKYAAVFSSLDACDTPVEAAALACASAAAATGYAKLLAAHEAVWNGRWERADVIIEGDAAGQHALRYSLYQLLSSAPFHSEHLSIPARALSGQVYKGAIFWDTEIFMFPFFLAAFPEVARNLVRYRIHTLPGAKAKAAEYGFAGAYYPWEGQEGGYDACTLFNITDVFTNRPMRTYFRDKQVHISGDVAWAVWKYVQTTGDTGLLRDGGWEVMLECARFFFSYAYKRTTCDEYVLLDVTGPDEYHERVANNAYTNYLAQYAVEATIEAARLLREEDPLGFTALAERLGFGAEEEAWLADFAAKILLPQPDPETKLIEQFDGYLKLEDCSLKEIKSRVLNPAEYLGGGSGLATTTRILKQADTVLLTHLLGERFSEQVKRANWDFYEPRTEHGSSLSACVYALVAAETGRSEFAYKYFLKTATVDLTGDSKQYVGTLYIGGTHPAANGGAWMVAAQGFCGIRFRPEGLVVEPRLPEKWKSVSLRVVFRGYVLKLTITHSSCRMEVDGSRAQGPAQVVLNGEAHALADKLKFAH
ncbi:MAG: glycosyl hydrolase family 65 protein [Verrucomicrobiota bacterium]